MAYFKGLEDMTTKKDVGLTIMTLRKKAGIKTQEELGRRLRHKKAKSTINKIETGRGNYSIDILVDIAEVLDCDISDFFGTKERPVQYSMIEKLLEEFKDEAIKEYESRKSK